MFFNALSPYGRRSLAVVLACLLLSLAWPARADCSDAPAPGVDWRRCYQDGRDFVGANLSGAQLRDASFTRADLAKANFAGADAYRAKFYSASMAGASFTAARVAEADFSEADLTGANLRGADFFRARLGGALWTDGKTRCADSSLGQCN